MWKDVVGTLRSGKLRKEGKYGTRTTHVYLEHRHRFPSPLSLESSFSCRYYRSGPSSSHRTCVQCSHIWDRTMVCCRSPWNISPSALRSHQLSLEITLPTISTHLRLQQHQNDTTNMRGYYKKVGKRCQLIFDRGHGAACYRLAKVSFSHSEKTGGIIPLCGSSPPQRRHE